MSIEQGGRLGAQNKMKLFLETFFDISFFPHLTKYISNMNFGAKIQIFEIETYECFAPKMTHILVLVFGAKIQIFREIVMLQTETF